MSLLSQLGKLVGAGREQQAAEAMREALQAARTRSKTFSRHAELAPQEGSSVSLRELASLSEAQADHIKEALQAANSAMPPEPRASGRPSDPNSHWARLVVDLESLRDEVVRYQELATHFSSDLPASAGFFEAQRSACERQCRILRALIARADPQATD